MSQLLTTILASKNGHFNSISEDEQACIATFFPCIFHEFQPFHVPIPFGQNVKIGNEVFEEVEFGVKQNLVLVQKF